MNFLKEWVKNKISRCKCRKHALKPEFYSFIELTINTDTAAIMGELNVYAMNVVFELSSEQMTNIQKRKEAFKHIKEEAEDRGLTCFDHQINLLIELCVGAIKHEMCNGGVD